MITEPEVVRGSSTHVVEIHSFKENQGPTWHVVGVVAAGVIAVAAVAVAVAFVAFLVLLTARRSRRAFPTRSASFRFESPFEAVHRRRQAPDGHRHNSDVIVVLWF